ncbi:electron transfer flavoprotein subunit beta/FixA family protein [Sebaldella sp. S0638]|uniref:electron transfer flavoprotein subunit beta/FixA family protein n=1 Tax=Sebaldella sp. S0638 TaxID=2957809 RepID=UPI00209F7CD9|nr:electron transfer flavoprotein subunit beta/FixA family protein [Sebaldella sp. S0638]MCP1223622.1 electron transfer flavoprotein subunit beta/FixA family protein [Sebaldella sp. S0638]
MLKIAVCIKQVPAFSEGKTDPETGVILRDRIEPVLNVYDLPALETALQIKEATEANIDVFTMGPEKAADVMREAYGMGADRGYLLSDKRFSGADVLATSYTLMQGMKLTDNYDLIICGKQTTDGDTAQVSGALAKWFGIPGINWVSKINSAETDGITVEQTMEKETAVIRVPYPCLLSVERNIYIPRLPSLKLKMAARKKEIKIITLDELEDKNRENYGLSGSPTKVRKIYPAVKTKKQDIMIKSALESADRIFEIINSIKN